MRAFVNAPSLHVLVVGDGDLAADTCVALREAGATCVRLRRPADRELARAVADADAVAVVSHDDIYALRIALVAEHARPGVALLVTIFDATVARQVVRAVPNCRVVSLGDAVAPLLARDCLAGAGAPTRARRARSWVTRQLRPYDASSRLLVGGVLGVLGIVAAETAVGAAHFGHPLDRAFYEAVKATAAIGPDAVAEDGPGWYAVLTGIAMLVGLALTAAATAGLVHRLTTRRLIGIVGHRTLPRRDHVVVVGLGQVGVRLCLTLRRSGIPVVGVERDAATAGIHVVHRAGIPVMVGDGSERDLLLALRAGRALALASVTSDDHVNVAVAVAALALREDLRVVLRAGDDDAVTETRALFPIGVVRDVNRLAGAELAGRIVAPDAA
jgi:voltage-gated potassium channel Kch